MAELYITATGESIWDALESTSNVISDRITYTSNVISDRIIYTSNVISDRITRLTFNTEVDLTDLKNMCGFNIENRTEILDLLNTSNFGSNLLTISSNIAFLPPLDTRPFDNHYVFKYSDIKAGIESLSDNEKFAQFLGVNYLGVPNIDILTNELLTIYGWGNLVINDDTLFVMINNTYPFPYDWIKEISESIVLGNQNLNIHERFLNNNINDNVNLLKKIVAEHEIRLTGSEFRSTLNPIDTAKLVAKWTYRALIGLWNIKPLTYGILTRLAINLGIDGNPFAYQSLQEYNDAITDATIDTVDDLFRIQTVRDAIQDGRITKNEAEIKALWVALGINSIFTGVNSLESFAEVIKDAVSFFSQDENGNTTELQSLNELLWYGFHKVPPDNGEILENLINNPDLNGTIHNPNNNEIQRIYGTKLSFAYQYSSTATDNAIKILTGDNVKIKNYLLQFETAFSLSFKILFKSLDNQVFLTLYNSNQQYEYLKLEYNAGYLKISIFDNFTSSTNNLLIVQSVLTTFVINQQYHIVFTHDKNVGCKMYVDKVQVKNGPYELNTIPTNWNTIDTNTESLNFQVLTNAKDMIIEDYRIMPFVVSQEQVNTLFDTYAPVQTLEEILRAEITNTSNELIYNIDHTSNWIETTSNELVYNINNTSNWIQHTSNTLAYNIDNTSNWIQDTSNVLAINIVNTSNWIQTSSNQLAFNINNLSLYLDGLWYIENNKVKTDESVLIDNDAFISSNLYITSNLFVDTKTKTNFLQVSQLTETPQNNFDLNAYLTGYSVDVLWKIYENDITNLVNNTPTVFTPQPIIYFNSYINKYALKYSNQFDTGYIKASHISAGYTNFIAGANVYIPSIGSASGVYDLTVMVFWLGGVLGSYERYKFGLQIFPNNLSYIRTKFRTRTELFVIDVPLDASQEHFYQIGVYNNQNGTGTYFLFVDGILQGQRLFNESDYTIREFYIGSQNPVGVLPNVNSSVFYYSDVLLIPNTSISYQVSQATDAYDAIKFLNPIRFPDTTLFGHTYIENLTYDNLYVKGLVYYPQNVANFVNTEGLDNDKTININYEDTSASGRRELKLGNQMVNSTINLINETGNSGYLYYSDGLTSTQAQVKQIDYTELQNKPTNFQTDWNTTVINKPTNFQTDWNTTVINKPSIYTQSEIDTFDLNVSNYILTTSNILREAIDNIQITGGGSLWTDNIDYISYGNVNVSNNMITITTEIQSGGGVVPSSYLYYDFSDDPISQTTLTNDGTGINMNATITNPPIDGVASLNYYPIFENHEAHLLVWYKFDVNNFLQDEINPNNTLTLGSTVNTTPQTIAIRGSHSILMPSNGSATGNAGYYGAVYTKTINISSMTGFTVSFWYYQTFTMNSSSYYPTYFEFNNLNFMSLNYVPSGTSANHTQFALNGTLTLISSTDFPFNAGVNMWRHLTLTFEKSQVGKINYKLYINGSQIYTNDTNINWWSTNINYGAIASSARTSTNTAWDQRKGFGGYFDDYRVYGRTLTADEVKKVYGYTLSRTIGNQSPYSYYWNGNITQAGDNAYITLPQTSIVPIISPNLPNFSISYWAKYEGLTTNYTLVDLKKDSSISYADIVINTNDITMNVYNGASTYTTTWNDVISGNTWNNYTYTLNYANNIITVDLYKDSVKQTVASGGIFNVTGFSFPAAVSATEIGYIGKHSTNDPSPSYLEDFRIYNRTLTQIEINNIFNPSAGGGGETTITQVKLLNEIEINTLIENTSNILAQQILNNGGGGGGFSGNYNDLINIPSSFPPSSHTHSTSEIIGLDTALANKASSTHIHTIENISGLQSALDEKQPTLTAGTNITIVGTTISSSGSSQWTTSGNHIYYNVTSGNVGIGLTSPSHKLDVVGDINLTGALKVGGANRALWSLSGNDASYISGRIIVNNGTNGGNTRGIMLWSSTDTNWGIYMGQSGASKSFSNGTACNGGNFTQHAIRLRTGNTANQGLIYENNAETCLFSVRGSDGMTYFKGNVGIGTTNPTNALDVNGNVLIKNTTDTWQTGLSWTTDNGVYSTNISLGNSANNVLGYGRMGFRYISGNDYAMTIDTNGNIGMKKNNPAYKLDVVGDVNITGSYRVNGVSTSRHYVLNFTSWAYSSPWYYYRVDISSVNSISVFGETVRIFQLTILDSADFQNGNIVVGRYNMRVSSFGGLKWQHDSDYIAQRMSSLTMINQTTIQIQSYNASLPKAFIHSLI